MPTLDSDYPTPKLSECELNVLRLLATGKGYKEIAKLLSIGVNTVHYHVGEIYAKLYAGNRTEAVVRALRKGIIQLDELQ